MLHERSARWLLLLHSNSPCLNNDSHYIVYSINIHYTLYTDTHTHIHNHTNHLRENGKAFGREFILFGLVSTQPLRVRIYYICIERYHFSMDFRFSANWNGRALDSGHAMLPVQCINLYTTVSAIYANSSCVCVNSSSPPILQICPYWRFGCFITHRASLNPLHIYRWRNAFKNGNILHKANIFVAHMTQ